MTEARSDDVTITTDIAKCPVHVLISRYKYLRLNKAVCTLDVCCSRLVPQCGCLQPTGQIQTHQPLLPAHLYSRRESNGKQTHWLSLSLHRPFCSLFKQHTDKCTYIVFNNLKFILKRLKRSYMFRSYDHPQGAYFVPC